MLKLVDQMCASDKRGRQLAEKFTAACENTRDPATRKEFSLQGFSMQDAIESAQTGIPASARMDRSCDAAP